MKLVINTLLLVGIMNSVLTLFAQMPPRPTNEERKVSAQRYFPPFKPKRSREQEQQLLPNPADVAGHIDFLKRPGTGLIRLYPDFECESAYIIRADNECANKIPGSASYSFREKEYTNDFLADVRLRGRFFITDGVLTQAFLVNLGNVSLESLSLNSDGMKFVTDFQAAAESREATRQYNDFVRGVKIGNYDYRKAGVAIENNTYAVRVVAYRANLFKRFQGWTYNVLEGDKRVDIIVAFRVLRKDADGSFILLWKELDRKKAVKLVASNR